MKNKHVLVGLAIAVAAIASIHSANAQVGGQAASGNIGTSSGAQGMQGQSDFKNSGKQAFKVWDPRVQNYVSPDVLQASPNDHSSKQSPYVRPMVNAGPTGLNQVNTAPMAPGSVDMAPFPSGQFHYGFPNSPVMPYLGPYSAGPNAKFGGMLPNTSLGSVDFNTVDTTGIAPAGMRSPGRGAGSPIALPSVRMPNTSTSTQSTFNWLQNTFFGP